jgi:FAD dependent monooxygenase
MEEKSVFKVIIIGASVTGLTLAHCLHRAGIDYVVLEKHVEVHPPIGAAVAILPNGARIMEQLGIFHHVERKSSSIERVHLCYQDGFFYDSLSPSVILERWFHSYQYIPHSHWLVKLTTCRSGLASSSRVWSELNFSRSCIRLSRTNQRF